MGETSVESDDYNGECDQGSYAKDVRHFLDQEAMTIEYMFRVKRSRVKSRLTPWCDSPRESGECNPRNTDESGDMTKHMVILNTHVSISD